MPASRLSGPPVFFGSEGSTRELARSPQHALVRALGLLAGYALIAAMGVALLGPARAAIDELGDLRGAELAVAVVGFIAGAAGAVLGVRYELAASTRTERMQRHLRMQATSLAILGIGLVLFVTWTWLPALLRVAAAAAGSGFILGFLAIFIPNRRRALEIRKINRVE